jgi:AMP nucleosidase
MKKGGIKTRKSAKSVFRNYTDIHIDLGIKAMKDISKKGERIRHYRW